ncbi:MAG TPA: hypothetical protein VGZ47_14485 [Gemmataceae bacterium]|jgi:hypothetical protein|nr:hypothetical protein [Gemmataceae bacterium]
MRLFLLPLLFTTLAAAQEKDRAPRGDSPRLLQASAMLVDGTVVIRIEHPIEQAAGPLVRGEGIQGSLPAYMVMRWGELRKLTLGKTVQAYRTDGKPADADAVLKALAKPKGVAVFIRNKKDDPVKPDPFYSVLLREDTIALVVESKDLYPQEP